jgi:hypothetical protein
VDWIELAQDRDKKQALWQTAKKFSVTKEFRIL